MDETNRNQELSQRDKQIQENVDLPNQAQMIIYLRRVYLLMSINLSITIVAKLLVLYFEFKMPLWISTICGLLCLICQIAKIEGKILFGVFILCTSGFFMGYNLLILQIIALGQIMGQDISVHQVKVELTIHQQIIYILGSGLIVFQLLIIYSDADFELMVPMIMAGVIFGFCLVYVQNQIQDEFLGAVQMYKEVVLILMKTADLISQMIIK